MAYNLPRKKEVKAKLKSIHKQALLSKKYEIIRELSHRGMTNAELRSMFYTEVRGKVAKISLQLINSILKNQK